MPDLAGAFPKSLRVERKLVHGTPHYIELIHVSQGWYARDFGFALECSVGKALDQF